MFQFAKVGDRVRIREQESEEETKERGYALPPHPLKVNSFAKVTLVKSNALYVIGESEETGEQVGTCIHSDQVEVMGCFVG